MKIPRAGSLPASKAPEVAGPKALSARADKVGAKSVAPAKVESNQAGATAKASRVSDIAADLKAGKISSGKAIDKVIERVLDRQLGAHAPASMREKVAVALRDALENDPFLASKVQALDRD